MTLLKKLLICTILSLTCLTACAYTPNPSTSMVCGESTILYVKPHDQVQRDIIYRFYKTLPTVAFLCLDLETAQPVKITWDIYLDNHLFRTVTNRSKFLSSDYFTRNDIKNPGYNNNYLHLHFPDDENGHYYEIIAVKIQGEN